MRLSLSDFRQQDDHSCGPVCAAIVLSHFGCPVPRQWASCSPVDGCDPLALVPAFRRAGLHVQSGEMTVADLKHHNRLRRPVIVLTRQNNCGHYQVVSDVSRYRIKLQCPTRGLFDESLAAFSARWWDEGRDVRYTKFGVAVFAD